MANTPYSTPTADFVTTTLGAALAQGATTATIGTGLTLPATNGILQVDYDSVIAVGTEDGPETISYATYTSGSGALTGLVRGVAGTTDVAHSNGSAVQAGPSTAYLGTGGIVACRAYQSAQQDIVKDTYTKVNLQTENFDLGGNFAASTFTAPVTGYYQVNGAINFEEVMGANDYIVALIYVNGTTVAEGHSYQAGSAYVSANVGDIVHLTATDTVNLYVWHSYTENRLLSVGTSVTYMSIMLLNK